MEAQAKVDAARFAKGLTYEQYIAAVKNNREEFENNYKQVKLSDEDRQFFAGLGKKLGKVKFLALGEDWCPDVYRGLPIAARIAEASPDIEFRVFPRDENLDIMNLYLNQGQFQSIPTFVFFDENFNELGRWIERPASTSVIYGELRKTIAEQKLSEQDARALMRQKGSEIYVSQTVTETVREIKELLTK
jgi:thiol-disulfide isomerase/thioredoxin